MLSVNNHSIFDLRINRETIFADTLMFLGLSLEFLFQGTIISQIGFICALLAGAVCIQYRPLTLKACSFIACYTLLIGYFVIRTANGDSIVPDISWAYLRTMCYCAIFMLFSYQYICRRSLLHITKLLSAVCIAVSFYLLFTGAIFSGDRMSSSGLNANGIGGFLAATVSLLGFQILSGKLKASRRILIFISLLLVLIILTGSRKSLFISIVPILLFYLFQQRRKVVVRTFVVIFVIMLVYLLITQINALYNAIGVRVEAMLEWFISGETSEESMNSRADYIELGIQYFKNNPWKGTGLFSFSSLPGAYGTYSHNNYVEMLVSGGIPALFLFYLPFLILLVSLLKNIKKDQTILFAFSFVVCILIMHVAMVIFYTRIELFVYLVLFACSKKALKE